MIYCLGTNGLLLVKQAIPGARKESFQKTPFRAPWYSLFCLWEERYER